jgi:hypothetical protein
MSKQSIKRFGILLSLLILFVLENLYYYFIKIGGGVFLFVGFIQFALIIYIAVTAIVLIVRTVRMKEWRNAGNYIVLASIPLVIFISGIEELNMDENSFQSKVSMKACYEGTMNTSRLFLREDKTFEEFNIGFFAYVHYLNGTWEMKGDTIQLKFNSKENYNLQSGDIVIKEGFLYKVQADTLADTFYYQGNCKGLN